MRDRWSTRVIGLLFEGARLAAERLAIASGGVLRDAIALTQSAINEQEDPPITLQSVDRAIGWLKGEIDRTLPERLLPVLRHVGESNRFPDECDDETRFLLLRERFVLEYQDDEPEPFYVLHPLVETNRRLRSTTP